MQTTSGVVFVSSSGPPAPTALADGSVRFGCSNNLNQMISGITSVSKPGSLRVLVVSSNGIIAVLIGLLLPAVQRSGKGQILPYIEQGLARLRPFFAPGGRLELRGVANITDGTSNTMLVGMSRAVGVNVLAGPAGIDGNWTGPIIQVTPLGTIGPGKLLPAV